MVIAFFVVMGGLTVVVVGRRAGAPQRVRIRVTNARDRWQLRRLPPPVEAPPLPPTNLEGVTVLRGQRRLEEAYKELRERPHLTKIQAIWSAPYNEINIMAYFEEESAWLAKHPDVAIERLVLGQDEAHEELRVLARQHQKFTLFKGEGGNEFEMYLCEYAPPDDTSSMSGIFVHHNPLRNRPELGMQIDSPDLKEFVYGLRTWFEREVRKAKVTAIPRTEQNVWSRKAEIYDDFICRGSDSEFLRDFIAQEDAFIEELVMRQSGDVSLLDFGAGTGRTLEYLRSKPGIRTKVALFIGFDHSEGMVQEARRKRDATRLHASDRTFYFLLDGMHAADAFWHGRVAIESGMNDRSHITRVGFDAGRYRESDKIVTCLLNTLGVVDPSTREAMLHNMFTAAGRDDLIVVSVFERQAFRSHARQLYTFLHDIVTDGEILPDSYNDALAEFRAGYYYSHWFDQEEIGRLVEDAGGRIIETRELTSQGMVIGRVVVATRRDEHANAG